MHPTEPLLFTTTSPLHYETTPGLEPLGITTLGDGVWKGNEPAVTNGVRLLGAPIGQSEYIENFGTTRVSDFTTLRNNVLKVDAVQYAWLLTYYCVVPRLNHLLRQVPPDLAETTAQRHDNFTLDTLQQLLGTTALDEKTQLQAKLPLRQAGLGLRDSHTTSTAAFWASWADSFQFLCERFPDFEHNFGTPLCNDPGDGSTLQHNPTLLAVQRARRLLQQTGLRLPTWTELRQGTDVHDFLQPLRGETYPDEIETR